MSDLCKPISKYSHYVNFFLAKYTVTDFVCQGRFQHYGNRNDFGVFLLSIACSRLKIHRSSYEIKRFGSGCNNGNIEKDFWNRVVN